MFVSWKTGIQSAATSLPLTQSAATSLPLISGPGSFNNNKGSTLSAREPIGNREGLSSNDIRAVEWIHNNCSDTQTEIRCEVCT